MSYMYSLIDIYIFTCKFNVFVTVYYEGLQDKLAQVKDARAALDALREEHREKLRRQAEEAERIRQMQMAHKLEIMRKKKQEYLQVSVSIFTVLIHCMCNTCYPTAFFLLVFYTLSVECNVCGN
jgi:Hepatocyte growth factor-regulated tyrosine kinase substrate.